MKKIGEIYSETSTSASLKIGYDEKAGKLLINSLSKDQYGRITPYNSLFYDGENGTLIVGEAQLGMPGEVIIGSIGGSRGAIHLDGKGSNVTVGGSNLGPGNVYIRNRSGNDTLSLNGEEATLTLGNETTVSNERSDGQIVIKNSNGKETIKLDGRHGNLVLGGGDQDGDISILNASGHKTIKLDGEHANLFLGGDDQDGDITLKNAGGNDSIVLNGSDGSIIVGGVDSHGDIIVKNNNDIETIKITGSNGDIEFLNADFAEEFDIKEETVKDILPGMVMILDTDSKLIPCEEAYDAKVVGVVAGGGNYKPGIVMDKSGGKNRLPIAMIGKVYCMVDAHVNPIKVGDMLTTSSKKGHAMKAIDKQKAFGSIVGKALSALSHDCGLIPVLVNLQ